MQLEGSWEVDVLDIQEALMLKLAPNDLCHDFNQNFTKFDAKISDFEAKVRITLDLTLNRGVSFNLA